MAHSFEEQMHTPELPHPPGKWKLRLWIAGAIVLVGLLLAVGLASHRPYLARQTLPDGTIITLVAIKTGDKHISPFSGPGRNLAALLPANVASWLKLKQPDQVRETYQATTDFMSLWITRENTNGRPKLPIRVLITDDKNNYGITDRNWYSRNVSGTLASGGWLDGLGVLSWPRRAEHLRLQVYSESETNLLAEFRVPNPARATTPPGPQRRGP